MRNQSIEYRTWKAMRWRCNPKSPMRPRYYNRGIRVCERWDSFESFYEDMGKRPSSEHSLDRIDNDKGYSPENCKWSTRVEQTNNTSRTNFAVTKDGIRINLMDIVRNTGIHPETIRYRIKKGWHAEELDMPPLKPQDRIRTQYGKFI